MHRKGAFPEIVYIWCMKLRDIEYNRIVVLESEFVKGGSYREFYWTGTKLLLIDGSENNYNYLSDLGDEDFKPIGTSPSSYGGIGVQKK